VRHSSEFRSAFRSACDAVLAGILVSVTASDFLHRAYARMKQD